MSSALLKQAISLHRAGKLAAAEAVYRRTLAVEPGNSDVLHFLGLVAHQMGRHDEAAGFIVQAIALRPTALYWYNLGHVQLARRDTVAAEDAFQRTIELAPAHAEALFQLGNMRLGADDLVGAAVFYRQAIATKPEFLDARVNLAMALSKADDTAAAIMQLEEARQLRPEAPEIHHCLGIVRSAKAPAQAIEDFRRALALKPDHVESRINLAKALLATTRHAEAIELLEEVSRDRPNDGEIHILLGGAFAEVDDLERSVRQYRSAAGLMSGSARPWVLLGNLYLRFGRFDEALGAYREARSIDPASCDAAAGMLKHLPSRVTVDDAKKICLLADDPALGTAQRRQLHFGLSAYWDAAGDYDVAFMHMSEGNRLRRMELEVHSGPFDVGRHVRKIDSIIEAFDERYFRRVSGFGIASELPVFVVGMPRSGTTMCEQVLASHSKVFGAGELTDIGRIVRELRERAGDELRNRDFAAYALFLDVHIVREVADAHLRHLERLAPAASRVVDKLPMNFQHLGLVATLFPAAKIINCRRDPMDVGLSCYSKDFAAALPWACDLEAIGLVCRQYDRLMAHWHRVLPLEILDFPYEDAVRNFKEHARRLIEHCGLGWEDACVDFHRTERQVKTASLQQVRRPVYDSSIRRWQNYRHHLAPLRKGLSAA